MQNHDSTANVVITCHALEAGQKARHIRAHTWKQALQSTWPFPYCVILRVPEGERPFRAVRLDTDGEGVVIVSGDTPEQARDSLSDEWAQHLKAYPCENVRRRLRPVLHMLKDRGVRLGDRWEELMLALAGCDRHSQARVMMIDFLRRVAPGMSDRDANWVLRWLEGISFHLLRHQVAATDQEPPRGRNAPGGPSAKGMWPMSGSRAASQPGTLPKPTLAMRLARMEVSR